MELVLKYHYNNTILLASKNHQYPPFDDICITDEWLAGE